MSKLISNFDLYLNRIFFLKLNRLSSVTSGRTSLGKLTENEQKIKKNVWVDGNNSKGYHVDVAVDLFDLGSLGGGLWKMSAKMQKTHYNSTLE